MSQEKEFTNAKNKTSSTFQSTSISPSSSPGSSSSLEPSSSSEPPPTDALRAMSLDREERTEATSTRDDTSNLCIDDELKLIIEKIQSFLIRNEQRQIGADINELQAIINVALTMHFGQIQTPIETFKVKYKLNLPLNTLEGFTELDNKISEGEEDKECRTFFKLMLSKQFDNEKTPYINIKAILKQYITKNVALLYTAQKEVRDQRAFKDTNFSKCLLSVINEEISEEKYLKTLKEALSNIKNE